MSAAILCIPCALRLNDFIVSRLSRHLARARRPLADIGSIRLGFTSPDIERPQSLLQLYDAPRLVTRKQMRLYLRTFTGGITSFTRASRCKRMTSNRPREVSRIFPRIVRINSLICCPFARPPFTAHLRLLPRLVRLQQPPRSSVLPRMLPLLLHHDPQIQRLLRLNPRPSTPPRTWLFPSNLSSHRGRTRLHLSTLYGRHRP